MKFVKREFSYPVEYPGYSDYNYKNMTLELKVDIDYMRKVYTVTYELNDIVPELKKRIESGSAVFTFIVENQMMFYRKSIPTSDFSGVFELDGGDIKGKVEILPVVVSTIEENDYTSEFFTNWFLGETTRVEKHDYLAFSNVITFDASHDIDPFQDISSIFSIKSSFDDNDEFLVSSGGNFIEIVLGNRIYSQYENIKMESRNQILLVNMLIMPALMEVLSNIRVRIDNEMSLDGIDELDWYRSLAKKFEIQGKSFKDIIRDNSVAKIANELLGGIVGKSVNRMEYIIGGIS